MGAMLMKRRKMMVRLRKWKHKRLMFIYYNEVRDELLIIGKQQQQQLVTLADYQQKGVNTTADLS